MKKVVHITAISTLSIVSGLGVLTWHGTRYLSKENQNKVAPIARSLGLPLRLGPPINAASCNQTDVQTAFNGVTATTPTVNIPAGTQSTCIWGASDTGVSLSVPSGSAGLTVAGAGSCSGDGRFNTLSCNDSTSIKDAMPNISGNPDRPVWSINVPSGVPLTVKGLTITGSGTSPVQTFAGAITVSGGSQLIHFTQMHLVNMNQVTLGLLSGTGGLFDLSILQQANASIIFRTQAATTNDWAGQIPWSQPTNLGTLSQWYFERDQIVGGSSDCDKGGRFVVRYNTFIAGTGTAQWLLTHPTGEPGGAIRGCRAWEAYNNTFKTNGITVFSQWFLSAGAGVTWGNTFDTSGGGSVSNLLTLIAERSTNTTYSQTPTPNGWGYCGTHQTGTGSAWDQNTNANSGYHCFDTPGMGVGDLITASATASFPTIVNTTTGTIAWIHQVSEGVYEWMDTYTPGNWINANQYSSISPAPLQKNADYFIWCNPSSTSGCTSFTGAQGVGSGTLASRPSTCTPGVGYFATDQGSWNHSGTGQSGLFYKCGPSANTWAQTYTPAIFPNPLSSGSTPAAATPTFNPNTGNYSTTQNVVISTTTSGATIYYTNDGTTPTTGSTVYTGAVAVSTTTTLQAIATAPGFSQSAVGTAVYTFPVCGNPSQNAPFSGSYTDPPTSLPLNITWTNPTAGCGLFYKADGTAPTCSSPAYPGGGINISTTTTIRVIACQSGYTSSSVMGGTWTISGVTLTVQANGTGTGTIGGTNCTPGVTYLASGTNVNCLATPSAGSTVSGSTGTGSAAACSGSSCAFTTNSTNSVLTYTFASGAAVPTFSPVAGTYGTAQSVTISSTTSGATLCYTTDGSTPTANGAGTCTHGSTYSGPVLVSTSLTLKAIASKSGNTDSGVGSAAYVINLPVLTPPFLSGGIQMINTGLY